MPNEDPHHGVSHSERTELTSTPRPKRKRRWGRRLLGVVLVLVILGGVLVVFAPKIAAPFVKNAIARTQPDGTTIGVDGLALSWTGGQHATGVRVIRPDGVTLADVDISTDKGLLSLVGGNYDLGTVTLEGEVSVDTRTPKPAPNGPTPTDKPAGAPGGRSGASVPELPASLRAKLDVRRLDVTVYEPGATTLLKVAGTGEVGTNRPATLDLTAAATRDGSPVGDATIKVSVQEWARGASDPGAAKVDADVQVTAFAAGVLDALLGQDGRLAGALGDTVDLRISAKGSLDDLAAKIHASAPRFQADADLAYKDGVLTAAAPITASIDSAGVLAWAEARDALTSAGVDVTGAPTLALTITDLRLPVPTGGFDPKTYDARRISALVKGELGRAEVRVPADLLGQEGSPRAIVGAPSTFTLDATNPSAGVRLAGSLATTIDGQDAGSVRINALASDLLTDAGAVRLGTIPRLAGTLVAQGVPTALLQPFAAASGFDLPADLGPTLELTVNADAPAPDAPTRLALTAKSAKLNAVGAFIIDGPRVSSDGPLTATLADPAQALTRLLADSGVSVAETGGVDLSIDHLSVNTEALAADPPDLANTTAHVQVRVGPIDGALAREGADPIAFRVPRSVYDATIEQNAAALTTRLGQFSLNGKRAGGAVGVALNVSPLASGQHVTGTISLAELDADTLGSLAGDEKLAGILRQLGPTFSATVRPDVVAGGATGAQLDLVGANVDLSGSATLADDGLTANARVHRIATAWLDGVTGRPGLAESALGPSAAAVVSVKTGTNASGKIGVPLDASIELTTPKMRTNAPVRVRVTDRSAEVVGGATLDWTLEPATLDALIAAGDNAKPAPVALASPVPVRLDIKRAFVPLSADETTPLGAEIDLTSTALTLRTPDGEEQQFTGLTGSVRTTDTPGQVRATLGLASADQEADTLSADLTLDHVGKPGAEPAITGTVRARRVPSGLIDAVAGTKGTAAQMLGAHANARVDLANFPLDGATVSATASSPNAELTYEGAVAGGVLTNTKPATVTLKRIEQDFGFTLAKFIPVVGGVTKNPKDQPATLSIPSLGLPIDGDLKKITLDLTADPGTGTLTLDKGLVRFIDPRAVEKGRSLGDSFQPFRVTMDGGVVRILDFVLPLGDFQLPASATYDLNAKTEDIVVQIPTGSLVGDALGGDLAPLRNILGSALNPPLRKKGAIGADNPWKLDPSWKPPAGEQKDTGDQLLEGLGGLLQDRLEKERQKKQQKEQDEKQMQDDLQPGDG